VTLSPEVYERWRRSVVGSITEAREVEIIFDLAGPLEGQRLLDVGCGDGVYLIEAARLGAAATGVDRSEAMLITARRHAADHGVEVELRQGDAHALPFDDGTFEVVIAITMLCLVPDAAKAVNEMARVTVPGGRVIIGELGRWSTWAAWRRVRGWFGPTIWRRARFRSARQLADLCREAGLRVERVRGGVYYPPFAPLARMIRPLDPVAGAVTTAGGCLHCGHHYEAQAVDRRCQDGCR
jgi:ubiquinone/menaquinone biosynthesis C-methylase UbiE